VLTILKFLVTAAVGVALGLGATYYSVARGFGYGAVRAGPWTAWPRSGSTDIDPYARAALSRTAEVPLGLAEGLAFRAERDSAGGLLDPRCLYRVSGPLPPARFWTLSVATKEGYVIANPAGRYGFTSAEILRRAGGDYTIAVAREVQPGNWLPLGATDRFVLVLRLYDSPVSATASAIAADTMPAIEQAGCL
jgi:hypothetical protein